MAELLIIGMALIFTLPRILAAVAPHMPAIIWAVRASPESPNYKCPRPGDRRSTLPELFPRRRS